LTPAQKAAATHGWKDGTGTQPAAPSRLSIEAVPPDISATYAAFREVLRQRWPQTRAVLLALVFARRRPKLFE
jgi:hypothetical protein